MLQKDQAVVVHDNGTQYHATILRKLPANKDHADLWEVRFLDWSVFYYETEAIHPFTN